MDMNIFNLKSVAPTSLASTQLAAYNCRTGVVEDCRIQTRRVWAVMWAMGMSFETLPRHQTLLLFCLPEVKIQESQWNRLNVKRLGRGLDNLMPD